MKRLQNEQAKNELCELVCVTKWSLSNFTVARSEIADGRSPVSEVESDDKAKAEGAARPSVKQFQDSNRNVATLDYLFNIVSGIS